MLLETGRKYLCCQVLTINIMITNRYLYTYISAGELGQETQVYLGLSVNQELFAEPQYAGMKVYAGQFATAEEAAAGTDITEMILAADILR